MPINLSNSQRLIIISILLCACWRLSDLPADITNIELPSIFSDNMIIQRDRPTLVWGKATPRTKIKVQLGGKQASTIVSTEGYWSAKLPPLSAGGPYQLDIIGVCPVTIRNVLVGDIWLCAGQSNMYMRVSEAFYSNKDIQTANYPELRFFQVSETQTDSSDKNSHDHWQVANLSTYQVFRSSILFCSRNPFGYKSTDRHY